VKLTGRLKIAPVYHWLSNLEPEPAKQAEDDL